MTMLQIPVSDSTAQRFQSLSGQQQLWVAQLVTDSLAEPTHLADVMDYISFKATQRGLTPDILERLLNEL